MPRIPLRLPTPGVDANADAIRARRGARGLSPLDGTLLNASEIAGGYNQFIGAIRNKNSLPDDIRETIILRVAARNYAAFEWHHHEHVGRAAGLTTNQLAVIRDVVEPTPSPSSSDPLTPLQAAALAFADASTVQVRVPDTIYNNLKTALSSQNNDNNNTSLEQQILEATVTTAAYNMVSRILVGLDVEDHAHDTVDLPGIPFTKHTVQISDGVSIAVRTAIKEDDSRPFVILVSSLLTNMTMWDIVLSTLSRSYNVITFDSRGHGDSSIPTSPATVDRLSDDVAEIISSLHIPTPLHAVIGESLGGATTLNLSVRHPSISNRFVVCGTQAKSPAASVGLWNDRIDQATREGMESFSVSNVARWFPKPSEYSDPLARCYGHIHDMVQSTPLQGFAACARALQSYEVPIDKLASIFAKSDNKKLLLVAGERDAKIPERLTDLYNALSPTSNVDLFIVPGSGHLPMVDNPLAWSRKVKEFLQK